MTRNQIDMIEDAHGRIEEIADILRTKFDQALAYNFVYVMYQLKRISQQADVHAMEAASLARLFVPNIIDDFCESDE